MKNITKMNRLDFGNHLRTGRESKNLNQKEMAETLGISTLHYALLERGGIASPGVKVLRSIADVYDLEFEDLANIYYGPKNAGNAQEQTDSRDRKALDKASAGAH